MFDFVRKPTLWKAWDAGLDEKIKSRGEFHLKSIQDLVVYDMLKEVQGQTIAEIGGGDSRVLPQLAKQNTCFNVDTFEGAGNGPTKKSVFKGVKNIPVFLGEYSEKLAPQSFDIVFSISVIEHVPTKDLDNFLKDGLRVLKPGGLWLHAIDMYLEDSPDAGRQRLFERYRNWMKHPELTPVGDVYEGPPKFSCDMATNPDHMMYQWGKISPKLIDLRQRAQSTSILLAARKTGASPQ
ncbi:MAG: class I SAM-dependent methyltransferase [Alphaproteobacteria bacterium]|nr:hypothetical protein [Hyphomonas sp.]MBR9806023.1 class I SAM-dependent methyltransferase [Alphaproteobacteria bacterium]|tara:strand:- start:11315 stop:12025 length:711 start_codon:yes stop_codon:yes gene_type:complete